ncbi:hypothetical protein X801_09415 [Opisthorchis viverrini]|uniref:Uncharacterized protein n=1 Tax=Opisthorchis viverrini TaxID=6198 RepID=A0A1S8WK24_OPIVI|nr:hypothetical protein X801_09415 [Opisthorchis viverrini]
MDAVFVQKSPLISLYVRSIHLYEIWNRLPPYEQFCNSNTNDNRKSPKSSKSSPKKSPKKGGATNQKVVSEEAPKPEYEPAIITGVVAVHKTRITNEKKLYVPVITTEEPEKKQPSPKGSPKDRKNSPKAKSPPKDKSPPKSKKLPKRDKSPDKGGQKSSPEKAPEREELPPEEPRTIVTMTEVNELTNKQSCRSAAVAYDVVVRLNIKTPTGDEAGHPMIYYPGH